jgi:hypothetical protein
MTDSTPSRGKIGALPHRIREQVNLRLLDGQVDSEILPWLNALQEVQDRMADRFDGEPISSMNLSAWRTGQYQKWLVERKQIAATKELANFASGLADAAGVRMSAGAKAIATGRIMERLQQMGEETELETLLDTVKAIKDLHKGDIDAEKVDLQRLQIAQAERSLILQEDKFHLEVGTLILKHIADAEVQRIAASKESQTVKMDQLILHIWGKRPDQPAAPTSASAAP